MKPVGAFADGARPRVRRRLPAAGGAPVAQTDSCPGDCDRDGRVTLSELVQVVNIGLGRRDLATCRNLDADDSGVATVDEMVLAVEKSMDGCPRMLEGPEALRGTSQLALSNMDHFRVLGFGFLTAAGGGGGAGVDETIPCDEGSKVVSRQSDAASCTITTAVRRVRRRRRRCRQARRHVDPDDRRCDGVRRAGTDPDPT